MIGPKKLGTIREQLRLGLTETGDDPIVWLETRMATPSRRGSDASGESEVLSSLRRVLQVKGRGKRRREQAGIKN
jgi:hypothetical protein